MRGRPGAHVRAPHLGESITSIKGVLGWEAGARAGKLLNLSQDVTLSLGGQAQAAILFLPGIDSEDP